MTSIRSSLVGFCELGQGRFSRITITVVVKTIAARMAFRNLLLGDRKDEWSDFNRLPSFSLSVPFPNVVSLSL